jgi:hypothetical protein
MDRSSLVDVEGLSEELFRQPPRSSRPKLRWTWPGVAVEERQLAAEIAEMAAAGFGGAEISNMATGLPPTGNPPETNAWASDHWVDRMRSVLAAAREAKFGLDLTIGPGWPWVSPAVSGKNVELSQQELLRAELTLGSAMFLGSPPRPVDLDPAAHLVAVTAARRQGQSPQGLALLDPKSAIDLTTHLDAENRLTWRAPPGDWVLFGFWRQPTRQHARGVMPEHPLGIKSEDEAPADCSHPMVVDHMRGESAEAALDYLAARVDKLNPHGRFAELFEDSLELETKGLLWTPAFLSEFRARRGYPLEPFLPVLHRWEVYGDEFIPYQATSDPTYDLPLDDGERVRRDYAETVTELWVDGHLQPMHNWAEQRSLLSRVQPYGSILDSIAAASSVDIPETEDLYSSTYDFWRMIASGAHISGATKVSMEHGAVVNADFAMTLRELKRRADKAFAAGVNQLITHVYPYHNANGARWPSWTPWSSPWFLGGELGFSDAWNGTNPQWRHMRPLADYFARAQFVLRAGHSVVDVAVYRDLYGYPSERNSLDAVPALGIDLPEPVLNAALTRAGITFDFLNPATLAAASTTVRDGSLLVQEPGYRALIVELEASKRGLVDSTRAMSGAVAQRLLTMAVAGLPVVFVGRFPEHGVSFRDPEDEDAIVRQVVAQLEELPNVRIAHTESEVIAILGELGVSGRVSFDTPHDVYNVLRRTEDGDHWYLWNSEDRVVRLTASFEVDTRLGPHAWDLWTGDVREVGLYQAVGSRIRVPLTLGPRETTVISFADPSVVGVVATTADEVVIQNSRAWLRSSRQGDAQAFMANGQIRSVRIGDIPEPITLNAWDLEVVGAVPTGRDSHRLRLNELVDWRDIDAIKDSSGVGLYMAEVELSDDWLGPGRGAYLELGEVEGGVQVFVNSKLASPASVAPWRIDVGQHLGPGINTFQLRLTTTLRNRINSLATQPGYEYLAARPLKTQPYGLLGPVRLVGFAEVSLGDSQVAESAGG